MTLSFKILPGDAKAILPLVKTGSIDTVFTSPEPPTDYNQMLELEQIMLELPRVLKQTGSIWVNMSDYHNNDGVLAAIPDRFVYDMIIEHDWKLMNTVIWNRPMAADYDTEEPVRRFIRSHEYLYWFVKDVDNYYIDKLTSLDRTVITAVYHPPRPGVFESGFPEQLIELTGLLTCPPNGRILDPFCGTGTTGVVALQHGMEFLGIEANINLIPKINQRLSECQSKTLIETTNAK